MFKSKYNTALSQRNTLYVKCIKQGLIRHRFGSVEARRCFDRTKALLRSRHRLGASHKVFLRNKLQDSDEIRSASFNNEGVSGFKSHHYQLMCGK
ncbi:MAG: hypothetical protein RR202_01060 [Bacteroidales bacterium]